MRDFMRACQKKLVDEMRDGERKIDSRSHKQSWRGLKSRLSTVQVDKLHKKYEKQTMRSLVFKHL